MNSTVWLKNFDRFAGNAVVNVSEVYDSSEVRCYKFVMTAAFVVSTLLLLCHVFVVVANTPKGLGLFKFFNLCYSAANFISILAAMMWKPVLLMPFLIVYPEGWLSPMDLRTSCILAVVVLWGVVFSADCVLLIILERYFIICAATSRRIKTWQKLWRTFIFGSNIFAVVSTFFLAVSAVPDDHLAVDILQLHLVPSGSLLTTEMTSLFILPPLGPLTIAFLVIWTVFFSTRAVVVFWMVYNNFIVVGTLSHMFSESTKKNYSWMLKTAVVHIMSSMVVILPCCLVLLMLLVFHDIPHGRKLFFLAVISLTSYPAFNVLVIFFSIRQNRRFFSKIFVCSGGESSTTNVVNIERTDSTQQTQ